MNSESMPGPKLKELIDQNPQLAYNPDNTEEELWKACPNSPQEVSALIAAQRISVPWELLNGGSNPDQELIGRLIRELEEKSAMPPEVAKWAVRTWAIALDIEFPEPAADPSDSYVVIDGAQRYGPADARLLNEWAAQGRLHRGMQFENQRTGAKLWASEVPGLSLAGVERAQPSKDQSPPSKPPYGVNPLSNYFRPETGKPPAEVKRAVDRAIAGAFVGILCGCVCAAMCSLLLALLARTHMRSGNYALAQALARRANLCTLLAIFVGLVYWAAQIYRYLVYHYPIGMPL